MKKIRITCSFLIIGLFFTGPAFAVLSYSMTPSVPGYSPLSAGINIADLAAGSDQTITAPINIGFSFNFDGINYTQFQISDNGYIHLGNDLTGTGYGNGSGDVIIPNDFTVANTLRPFIAPLWEDLASANIGGGASYKLTGIAPARILTIEWNKVSWRFSTGTDQVSFQVVLHETSNIIDFIYKQGPIALGPLPSASIGLGGVGAGNFYSLNNSGANPTPGFNVNTTTINTKPADGQMYRWIPTASLPIELLFFKGKFTDNGNLLEWKTATELNNDYFTLEKSKDANYFEPIAFIKGAGNSQSLQTYDYLDNSFSEDDDILYYRLKQTDFDRTANYSSIISVDVNTSNDKPPVIYYDKVISELNISYRFPQRGAYTLEIIDMSGKIIAHYPIEILSKENTALKFLLSFHSEGLFIAKLIASENEILSQSKFIK